MIHKLESDESQSCLLLTPLRITQYQCAFLTPEPLPTRTMQLAYATFTKIRLPDAEVESYQVPVTNQMDSFACLLIFQSIRI